MSWVQETRALLMLLLLASVLCNEIGVLFLLLPYLKQNNYEKELLSISESRGFKFNLPQKNLLSTHLVKLLLNFALLFCHQL